MSDLPPLFDLLLKTLPKSFREGHREGIRDLLAGYAQGRSVLSRARMWLRAAGDVLWVAVALRMRRSRHPMDKRTVVSRTALPARVLSATWQDVRYGFRSLGRDAGLVAFATLIVGLGVGASVTVFSVFNALLLRPLPFDQPDALVWISNGEWGRGQQLSALSVQVAHLEDLRTQSEQLTDVAGYSLFDRAGDHTLTGDGDPERLTRLRVTENFFQLLGVTPLHGRLFTAEEVQWNGPSAVLLDHGFWMRRFAGDRDVVGRSIRLNGAAATVVGILPVSFDFPAIFAPENPIDFVAPFPLSEETNRQGNTLALIGRLRTGASLQGAQAEAAVIAERPTPDRRNAFTPYLVPLHRHVSGRFQSAVVVLAGAVGLVMLIVCANLSNLLLARGTMREREMTLRAALGANRSRLIRQMLAESLVLAGGGAALGLGLAVGSTRLLAQLEVNIPLLSQARVDGVALGITLGLALATGIVFGVMPAVRMSAVALHQALRDGGRGSSHDRRQAWVRHTLVVVEVALACVLLIGAGLLMRSLLRVMDVDLGFQPARTVTVRIDPSVRFPSPERRVAFYDDALRRVRAAPDVETAGLTDVLPTAFNRRWCVQQTEVCPFVRVVSEEYLRAMGLSLVSGRDFTAGDDASAAPVVVINDELAAALWPEQPPLGRRFRIYPSEVEVIGVVRGTRHLTPEQEPGPEIFFSFRQVRPSRGVHLITRGADVGSDLPSAVRAALLPLDRSLPINEFRPMQEIIDRSLSPRRFLALLLAGFAGFALLLAALGIYGVISYSVNQQKQELGIRMALGASAAHLHHRVLRHTLGLAGAGLAIGLVTAWMLGRVVQGLLFGVTPSDPVTYGVAPVVLLGVAALAGYLPARRATRFDPVEALRTEG